MPMTKRDFEAFARILKEARSRAGDVTPETSGTLAAFEAIRDVEREMIRIFKGENPRFDADRFLRAAGAQ